MTTLIGYPFRLFLKYVINKSLGKFLKNPLRLSNQDLNKKELCLKDLQFDCEVLNEIIESKGQSTFKIIWCNIKQVTVRNWLMFLQKRPQGRGGEVQGVPIEIQDIDILVMPVAAEGNQQEERPKKPDPTTESKQAKKAKPKANGISHQINELLTNLFQNIEIDLNGLCIRVMTREQTHDFEDIPTFLLRLKDFKLCKEPLLQKAPIKELEDPQAFLNGKKLTVGEISLHLMQTVSIYQEISPASNAPRINEINQPAQDGFVNINDEANEGVCPWSYPILNHPSTIILFKSHNAHALSFDFSFVKQEQIPKYSLKLQVFLAQVEGIFTISQIKEILNFNKYIREVEAIQEAINEQASKNKNFQVVDQSPESNVLLNEHPKPQLDNRNPEKTKAAEQEFSSHPRSERTGKQSRQKDMKKSCQSIQQIQEDLKSSSQQQKQGLNTITGGINFEHIKSRPKLRSVGQAQPRLNYLRLKDELLLEFFEDENEEIKSQIDEDYQNEIEVDLVLDNDKNEFAINDEAVGQEFERAGALDGQRGMLNQSSQSMQQAKKVSFVDLDVSLSLVRCSLKVVSDFKPVFDMQAQYDRVFSAFAKQGRNSFGFDFFDLSLNNANMELSRTVTRKKINSKQNPFGKQIESVETLQEMVWAGYNKLGSLMLKWHQLDQPKVSTSQIDLDQSQDDSVMFRSALEEHIEEEDLPENIKIINKIFRVDSMMTTKETELVNIQQVITKFQLGTKTEASNIKIEVQQPIHLKVDHQVLIYGLYLSKVIKSYDDKEAADNDEANGDKGQGKRNLKKVMKQAEFQMSMPTVKLTVGLYPGAETSKRFKNCLSAIDFEEEVLGEALILRDESCKALEVQLEGVILEQQTISFKSLSLKVGLDPLMSMYDFKLESKPNLVEEQVFKDQKSSGGEGFKKSGQAANSSSDEDENYIIYEDDDKEGSDVEEASKSGLEQQHLETGQKQPKHNELSTTIVVNQLDFILPGAEVELMSLHVTIQNAITMSKGVMCLRKHISAQQTLRKSQQADPSIHHVGTLHALDITAGRINFIYAKEYSESKSQKNRDLYEKLVALAQLRMDKVKVNIEIGLDSIEKEKITLGINLNDFVIMDYTQQEYKLYNQLLQQQNQGIGSSFYDATDKAKLDEDQSLSSMCSMPLADLIRRYEKCLLVSKHSSFVDAGTDFLECSVAIEFDISKKYVFGAETFTRLFDELPQNTPAEDYIELLFGAISALEANPMDLRCKFAVRDLMVRAQPLLQQKDDEPESLWHELNFIYAQRLQQNKKKRAKEMAKEMVLQSTTLAKEAARVLKVLESKNSIMSLKPIDIAIFKPIGSQGTDLLKLEVHIQRVALDVHPVVKFKDYFEVFGNDLQKGKQHRHINFPTFDGNLKFRISQRMVLYVQELKMNATKEQLNGHEQMSMQVVTNNFSINLVDQSQWVEDLLNPSSLMPGIPNHGSKDEESRPPLRLNEGTPGLTNCTYLESLGFTQIFLADFLEVKLDRETLQYYTKNQRKPRSNQEQINDYDRKSQYQTTYAHHDDNHRKGRKIKKPKTFEKFRIQTNVKKVSLYLTRDSNKTLKHIVTCLESIIPKEPDAGHPAQEQTISNAQKGPQRRSNESSDEVSNGSNLSNIFDSLLKDYSQFNTTKVEGLQGLPDFENIPHKVSMAPKSSARALDQDHLFHDQPGQNQSSGKFTESLNMNLENVFKIDQINDHSLKLLGCKRIDLPSFMKSDYIAKQKKTGIVYKNSHRLPNIRVQNLQELIAEQMHVSAFNIVEDEERLENVESNDVNTDPYAQMQPQIALQLHIRTVDIKLFQGSDFDFKVQEAGERPVSEISAQMLLRQSAKAAHNQSLHASRVSMKKSKVVLDDQYLDPLNNQELSEKLFYQAQNNRIKETAATNKQNQRAELPQGFPLSSGEIENFMSEARPQPIMTKNFRRKRDRKRGNYHQILLKNVLLSSFKMKNTNFKNSEAVLELYDKLAKHNDKKHKILYKYEKQVVSIQQMYIKETISSRGTSVDTFHLPFSYKFDNFCHFVTYTENYVKVKQVGFRAELQPLKLKLRQEVMHFLLDFFEVDISQEKTPEECKASELLQPVARAKQTNKQRWPDLAGGAPTLEARKRSNKSSQSLSLFPSDAAKKSSKPKKAVPVYVKELRVSRFQLSLSYSSNRLQINDLLSQKNMLEYLNIFNINDLVLEIKEYNLRQRNQLLVAEALKHFMDFEMEDIMFNQKLNIVGAIGPMKGICNVGGALYGVLSKPMETGLIYRGFAEGLSSLYDVLGEESDNLRKKMVKVGAAVNPFQQYD